MHNIVGSVTRAMYRTTAPVSSCTAINLAIGHVRYINILAWVRGFRVKIANFSCFFCPSIPKRDLDTKKRTPNIEVWHESLGAMLEYWYIERGLFDGQSLAQNVGENPRHVPWNNIIIQSLKEGSKIKRASHVWRLFTNTLVTSMVEKRYRCLTSKPASRKKKYYKGIP